MFQKHFLKGLKPENEKTITEWAERFRVLPRKSSAEAGMYRVSRTPYMRKIMDSLSPSDPVEKIVFMKSAQVGGSEAGINWISFIIAQEPAPTMIIQPTVELAKRFSIQRIAPAIESCEILRNLVLPSKSRDSENTQLTKSFPSGMIILSGSNSAASMRQAAIRNLFFDEIDSYKQDVDGEGSPLLLAEKRTTTFPNRKIFYCSTPTIKDESAIEKIFLESDQQKYFVECPFCRGKQDLKWSGIVWEKTESGEHLPDTAKYQCEHCNKDIDESYKTKMLRSGEWIATKKGKPKMIGFHINSLYSPPGWKSWGECVSEFLEVKNDSHLLKTWVNTTLGETFEDQTDLIEWEYLYTRREAYTPDEIPNKVLVLTMGVDTQGDSLVYEIIGWCESEESYSIEYKKIDGNPDLPGVWNQLLQVIEKEYTRLDGQKLKVGACCIDSGGNKTDSVYRFCSGRHINRIYAIKGSSKAGMPILANKPKKLKQCFLFSIGTDTAKDIIFGRLGIKEPGPGFCHFSLQHDQNYFLELTAEKAVTTYKNGFGTRIYKKHRRRNESLDTRVYAIAGLKILNPKLEFIKDKQNRPKTEKQKKYKKLSKKNFVNHW